MRFALLGPLVVAGEAGDVIPVQGARLRALLAGLLLQANTPVAAEVLADGVWDGKPPAAAARTLTSHVGRLRRLLGPQADRVEARANGYLIRVEQAELDILEFESLCRTASAALRHGAWKEAAHDAAGALGLWRGQPLTDVPSQTLRDNVMPRLEHLRIQAAQDHAEAGLHLGRHESLLAELSEMVAAYPLHERLRGQLMLALYRCGRQAEALAAYQDTRTVLVEELGTEPGQHLQHLHEQILAGDTDLSTPEPAADPAPTGAPTVVPRQLPAAARHFTGRRRELDLILDLPGPSPHADIAGGPVVISAIDGMAGIGKTALAVEAAHRLAEKFPDGQLYVNLRGFDPDGVPIAAGEAVRRFLHALGVSARHIPADLDEQAALYRSRLAGRRMLVLLDNARDAAQVRPLLPGSPGSLVLITSRNQLGSLVAADGAIPLTLGPLTAQESRDLLIGRLGRERVLAEEHAVAELIDLCARLPLALNIAAARAALRPARRLSQLVEELRDARQRLDTLALGDDAVDVREVFSWSYQTLGPQPARVFRLLGLHPGPDLSLEAAASLTARDPEHTRRALDALTAAHLLTEHTLGRYSFHDLLRVYAADQARIHDSPAERQDALRRVCDFYLHTSDAAERLLNPDRPPARLDPPASGTCPRSLADDPAAMAWFQAEHSNLLAAQRAAAAYDWHPTVWHLAWNLTTFHYRQARQDELEVWPAALHAAAHLPGPRARTLAHRRLANAYAHLGRHQEAIEHLHQALALAEDQHDPADQAAAHYVLANAWARWGEDRQALHHATRGLELVRTPDRPTVQAIALNQVGWYAARLGDYETARARCQAALALYQCHHDPEVQASTLDSLGYIEYHTGHHHQSIDHYEQALALFRSLGNTYRCADTLDDLGNPHAALGQDQQARAVWHQALELYRQQERTAEAERVQQRLGGQ